MWERKPDDESISRVLRTFPERAKPAGWLFIRQAARGQG